MLKQSLSIGKLKLCNRLVMPPMATRKTPDGLVTQELCKYYKERSGWVSLIIVEHAFVSPEGKAHEGQLSVASDEMIPGLQKLTSAVHSVGNTKVFSQINHAGTAAGYETGGQDDIDRIIRCFADAAVRVKRAGFDGVEIHSAHGYLLNQFYSPLTNRRTDLYNGSTMEGRTKLHVEIINAVREAVGKDFPIALRFGACDYKEGGSLVAEAPAAAKIFEKAGVDMLDISGGLNGFNNPNLSEPGWFKELSEPIRKAVSVPVLLTGGIRTAPQAEMLLESGCADLIGMGRPLIKNADWMKKVLLA